MSSVTAIYSSPIYQTDPLTGQQVQLYRDPETGATIYQTPTETQLLAEAPASQPQTTPAPAEAQAAAAQPAALHSSPEIEIDPATGRTILAYRDQQTGETQYQVPTQAQLQAYEHAAAISPAAVPHDTTT